MRRHDWQRVIAFATSAAIVLSTNGMQTILQEIGNEVHAEELNSEIILEEEWADAGSGTDAIDGTDTQDVQEIQVLSSYEAPEIVLEGIEVADSEEVQQLEENNTFAGIVTEQTGVGEMLVDIRLTEIEAAADANTERSANEQESSAAARWMNILAIDRGDAADGEATVRIYLTNDQSAAPAIEVEAVLFEEWQETLPSTVTLPPVVLDNVLNQTEDLSVTRTWEYKTDENGDLVKDAQGNAIVTTDYLEFTLPAGGQAEFAAAFLYEVSDTPYSMTAYADAVQGREETTEAITSILYDAYTDKEYDNELTLTWEPEEENETVEAVTEAAETTAEAAETAEETTEVITEAVTEETTEAATETITETETTADEAAIDETTTDETSGEQSESTAAAQTESTDETSTETSDEAQQSESDTDSVTESGGAAETENESELSSEVETEFESELSSEVETELESELSSEVETESELSSEAETELESELSSEAETESESELNSEAESETESEQIPEEIPVSSIRVIMTKELEETEDTQTAESTEILSEESSDENADFAEEILEEQTDTASDSAEAESEADYAAAGQTYIVRVQAEDLQPNAIYDSTVTIHLIDLETGLPASDVTTAVCQMKEDITASKGNEVSTLYGAVQTPDGIENLVVTRVQETETSEDGITTITDDYLEFKLPAESSAEFYIGFTYETQETAYEKQLMIDVKAVQYIPVQETETEAIQDDMLQETEVNTVQDEQTQAAESEAGQEETAQVTDTVTESEPQLDITTPTEIPDFDTISSMAGDTETEELAELPPADTAAKAEQELLSAATESTDAVLVENGELGVKTQSSDEDAEQDENQDSNNAEETNVDQTTEAEDEEVIEVDVLSSGSLVTMTWAANARAASTTKTIYFDTCHNGGWNDWTVDCQIYIYLIGPNTWGTMELSSRTNTLETCSGKLWEYTVDLSTCTGVIFANTNDFSNETRQTVDVYFNDASKKWYSAEAPCFRLDGGASGSKKTVYYLGDLGLLSKAGETLYFFDMTDTVETVIAVFSTADSSKTESVPMTDSDNDGYLETVIPADVDGTAYTSVKFIDSAGNQLGNIYNLFNTPSSDEIGVEYDSSTKNTFYYSATQWTDGSSN